MVSRPVCSGGPRAWFHPVDPACGRGLPAFRRQARAGVAGWHSRDPLEWPCRRHQRLRAGSWRTGLAHRKWPLLTQGVRADLRIRGADIDTSGLLERDYSGALRANDVRFRVPASLFAGAVDVPSLKLLGQVSGTLTQVQIKDGVVAMANGHARWSDAGVSGAAEARFSDILAKFATRPDSSMAGTLADDGKGNLEVNGSFSASATGFQAEAFLSARNDDARIQEALRYIGEAQPDGSAHLVISGQLFKLL
ncbi:MAG: hypothetical protein E6Q43_05750 [Dokdonella sp.]|nr:MAG: hypothetical protein E6Q43_05750 [Dokdonella sp.]